MRSIINFGICLGLVWFIWWLNLSVLDLKYSYPPNDGWDYNWPWWQFPLFFTELVLFLSMLAYSISNLDDGMDCYEMPR